MTAAADDAPAPLDRVRRRVPRWVAAVLGVGVAVQALMLYRLVSRLGPHERPALKDSIIFEYIGWYLSTGADLYVDAWEVKPPLNFEITAVLAVLSGGSVTVQHWLGVAVSTVAALACLLLVGALVRDLGGSGYAAAVGAISVYALAAFYWRAAFGYKAKYVVIAAGLLAIYLARRDRPLSAGVAGAAAVGLWQLGVVYPVLAFLVAFQRGGRTAVYRFAGGATAALVMVFAPVVLLWDATGAMLVQVVFTPLLVSEGGTLLSRLFFAIALFGPAVFVVGLGGLGVVRAAVPPLRRDAWWLPAGAAWFLVVVLLFDLDYFPDLFPLLAFAGVGVGLAVDGLDGDARLAATALVGGAVVASVVTLGSFYGFAPYPVGVPGGNVVVGGTPVPPYSGSERRILYWWQLKSDTCRIFAGPTQRRLVDIVGGSMRQETCGDFWPAWRAVVAKFF